MVTGHVDAIDRTVEKTHLWINEVARRLDHDDRREAYHVLRAVLHGLRDRLSTTVAAHVAAQLPMLLRGLWFEGWDPNTPRRRMHRAELLEAIRAEAMLASADDAERAVRAVAEVLWEHLGEGTLTHVVDQLPADVQILFY